MEENIREEINPQSRFPDGFRILKGRQEYITYVGHSSIRIWASDAEAHFDSHMHSAVEIIMPDSGISAYQLPERTYHVKAGEILIIPSGYPHALTETGDISRHLFLFEPAPLMCLRDMPSIEPFVRSPIYLKEDTETRRKVSVLLRNVIDCYYRQEPLWNLQCYSFLMQVYAFLGREYLLRTAPGGGNGRFNIESPIMNSAITYINEHYMEEISLEQVADFAGFSKYYFSRVFKSFAGMSFSDYLTIRRLNAATDLLIRTNRSVRKVALASGFSSMATFNRVFRQHKNCTPTQFRVIYTTSASAGPDIDSLWDTHQKGSPDLKTEEDR